MKKNEPRISHTTSKKVEYYVIRFDGKEFRIVVKDCKRLHKNGEIFSERTKKEGYWHLCHFLRGCDEGSE